MRTINREHPVQVIDLVLQQLRAIALEFRFVRLPAKVVVAHANAVGAQDAHEEVREGKAIVPDGEIFLADVDDLRVDQDPGPFHLDVDQAQWRPDLRRSDAAAASEARLPVTQRIGQVIDHNANRRRLRVRDQFTAFSKHGIAKKANSTDGHGAKVGLGRHTVNHPRLAACRSDECKPMQGNNLSNMAAVAALSTVLLAGGLSGCSDSTGGSTPTSQIVPQFAVSSLPSSVTIAFGQLQAEGFASIRLPDDDELRVSAAGQEKAMRWTVDPLGGGYYSASLSELAAGSSVTISLLRGDGANAPASTVTMPEAVNVTAPQPDTVFVTNNNLTVKWTPSGSSSAMAVRIRTISCDRPGAGQEDVTPVVGDPGTATVFVSDQLLPPLNPGEGCSVDVMVERANSGTVDDAFADGGSIMGRQVDAVRIRMLQP